MTLELPKVDWDGVVDVIHALPCRLLGHHWVEVNQTFRRSTHNSEPWKMRFVCSRCHLMSGATNVMWRYGDRGTGGGL